MKMFIVFAVVIAAVLAAPVEDPKDATILRYNSDNIGIDGYNFDFETSNGISRSESAVLKNIGTDNEALSVKGTITWTAADGEQYTLNFLADEKGFQPEGAHLPA